MKTWLLTPPSFDDVLRLLRAWRFWVLGALLGGLLGASFYSIFLPDYRARATVVIDFNAEQSWPVDSDKELFYFLEREARKLEEVAWSDATLQKVADETGFLVSELRAGKLELSQPEDGGWHFYATDPEASVAVKLASLWAKAFTERLLMGVENAIALDATRKAMEQYPTNPLLQASLADLESKSLGITPQLEISAAATENLPVSRTSAPGIYVLAGAGLFLALSAALILFAPPSKRA